MNFIENTENGNSLFLNMKLAKRLIFQKSHIILAWLSANGIAWGSRNCHFHSILIQIARAEQTYVGKSRLIVGSMVINQSYLISKKEMFNPFNITYQPYYSFQAPSTSVLSSYYPQGHSFLFPQFILQNAYQNGISLGQIPISHSQLVAQGNQDSNRGQGNGLEVVSPQILGNKSIIKEKIIKKPANRPATYLTERKYYLSQALQEETNLNRKLRPRVSHKKSQKTTQKCVPPIQNNIIAQGKPEILRDDNGSSQIFETSEKKKIENGFQEVSGNPAKTMDLSTSKEESK